MRQLRRFEIPLLLAVVSLLLGIANMRHDDKLVFEGDDLRYINYAVSLHDEGTFGLVDPKAPQAPIRPGNANAPLYPFFIAGMMFIDSELNETLHCLRTKAPEECVLNLEGFILMQHIIVLITLLLIYYLAKEFSGRSIIGWIAALLAVGSTILTDYANIFMTEILIFPAFSALNIAILKYYRTRIWQWAMIIGFMLAILTLVRPSYLYLLYATLFTFTSIYGWQRSRQYALSLLAVIVGFIVTVSPWAIRNKMQFDDFTLTSGGYAEAILAQRINYNQMSYKEAAVAFIYWFPDIGDSVARRYFPPSTYEKLGWEDGGYYKQGYRAYLQAREKELGGRDRVMRYMIKEEILGNLSKHIITTLPLAARGLWIGKYWSLLGFIAMIALIIHGMRRKDLALLWLSLPALFMVGFHAFTSVSISRYNLPLIMPYTLCMAWYMQACIDAIVTKYHEKWARFVPV